MRCANFASRVETRVTVVVFRHFGIPSVSRYIVVVVVVVVVIGIAGLVAGHCTGYIPTQTCRQSSSLAIDVVVWVVFRNVRDNEFFTVFENLF